MLGTHGTGDDGLCPVGLSTLGAVEQVGVSPVQQQADLTPDVHLTSLVRPFLEWGEMSGELFKSNNYIVELIKSAFYRAREKCIYRAIF
jgi:hypothetical protein